MEKSFEPQAIESKWYAAWEAAGDFKPHGDGTPYCILLPPPNVTGTLHMGHAFQQTVMDALTRYHRMRGFRTLWQGGTDHAGIATQKIVENQLAVEGKSRHDLGRAPFIERVWKWKEESGSTITNQMRRLGASVDWSRERFTMDEGLSAAVKRVFVQWYRDGLLYRGRRLVNWDPVLMTAVSDLEVNNEEKEGSLWSIRYPASDGGEGLVVATTRPETMLGDVAVAVHPEDERYQALIGKTLKLPLTGREIPVIADDYVDREFGTGCVKITPAHDFNDWQIGARHKLTPITILTLDAKINDNAPEKYRGLDRFAARKAVLADLEAGGLLVETKKHKLQVPVSQRTDAVIEPMLTDQWFLDLTSDTRVDGKPGPGGRKAITEPALAAVRDGAIKFVPENWSTTYNQWLENIQDWCVSRQLWWGHQIPAWYDEAGNIFVGEDEADALAHATTQPVGVLRQDADVLDTWFSAALWPFSTLGWPGDAPVKNERGEIVANWLQDQAFLPSAVLVTGFDIIFFWVARMVMATQYFTGKVPFREVYINAIVRDAEGQKMSKSKGNTIDPLDLIDGIDLESLVKKSTASLLIPQVREKVEKRIRKDYPQGIAAVGTDALRFTFAALATYGRTINFDLKRAEGYKAFCNKLWNAARFVLMNCEGQGFGTGDSGFAKATATEAERWILARLRRTLVEVEAQMKLYRFDLVAQALYEFVWNEYCDWFVELAKPALGGEDKAAAESTRHTLLFVLEAALRALHPITPFITEEIFQSVAPLLGLKETSIAQRNYPRVEDFPADDAAASAEIEWLRTVLTQIRRIRSEMNIAPGKTIPLLYANGSAADRARVDKFAAQIAFLARTESQRRLDAGEAEPAAAAAIVGEMKLLIPLAGLIDLSAEKARLDKEIKRLDGEIAKSSTKLANFGAKTPPAVVEQEKQRVADFTTTLNGLREQWERLKDL
ncbi:MAG: valine--tRNA ligase [Rudaea sp.]|uniref:valine--tRNA ligase n=1 Tax=unclassified Rudaea TaxID=2627037 RepID=UPI0010F5B65F|nr:MULTISPECIES: valine--tRNA ligase [unclassified Rudaea]MBN8887285.1 valine--tRNA ligase [Rudaea sp.]